MVVDGDQVREILSEGDERKRLDEREQVRVQRGKEEFVVSGTLEANEE